MREMKVSITVKWLEIGKFVLSVVVQAVRIRGSHPRDPGSSPGDGMLCFLLRFSATCMWSIIVKVRASRP